MADPLIALQIGAESFQDEGVEAVLDTVTDLAGVNALFSATPTWSQGPGKVAISGADLRRHAGVGSSAGTDPA